MNVNNSTVETKFSDIKIIAAIREFCGISVDSVSDAKIMERINIPEIQAEIRAILAE